MHKVTIRTKHTGRTTHETHNAGDRQRATCTQETNQDAHNKRDSITQHETNREEQRQTTYKTHETDETDETERIRQDRKQHQTREVYKEIKGVSTNKNLKELARIRT